MTLYGFPKTEYLDPYTLTLNPFISNVNYYNNSMLIARAFMQLINYLSMMTEKVTNAFALICSTVQIKLACQANQNREWTATYH